MVLLNHSPRLHNVNIYYKATNSNEFFTGTGNSIFTSEADYCILGYGYHDETHLLDIPFINSLLDKNVFIVYACTSLPENAIPHERIAYVETGFRWFTHLLIRNPQEIKAVFHNSVTSAQNKARLFATHFKSNIPIIETASDLPVLKQIQSTIKNDKTFLIETLDGLGDILLSLPTAETLHSQGWKVQYLVEHGNESILDNIPFISKVYNPNDKVPMHLMARYVSLSGRLSKYNLQINQQHRVYSTAEHCGIKKDELVTDKPKVILTADEKKYAKEKLRGLNNTVGICRYAINSSRAYPKEHTQKLCSTLTQLGFVPVLISSQKEEFYDCINLSRQTNIRQLMAIVNELDYVITVDTGVLHIAGALDKPTLALFGPIDAAYRCSTYKNCYPIQANIACSPCMDCQWVPKDKRQCNHERGYCMRTISPEVVIDKLKSICNATSIKKEYIKPKLPLFLEGYAGIGDGFWQRPFIKELCKTRTMYLMTYTPQVYWDIPNLKPVRPPWKSFKHHNKIADRTDKKVWYDLPEKYEKVNRPDYWVGFRKGMSISEQFCKAMPIDNYDFTFPVRQAWIDQAKETLSDIKKDNRKVCIIHFPTRRTEWTCEARDPKPDYLQLLIDKYKDEYFFISVADLQYEAFTEQPRNIDHAFHFGELKLEELFGLIKLSDMVISPNCFLLPMSIAIGTKTFGVYGGCQKPELFLDDKIDLSNYGQVTPEPFCNCLNPSHNCFKDIERYKILNAFEELKNRKEVERIYRKKNLLIYRVGTMYHKHFINNTELRKRYHLVFQKDPVNNLERYLKEKNIDSVISVDYPPEHSKDICDRLGINWIFNEAFLGVKNVFDKTGAHFDPNNDIKSYIDKVKVNGKIKIPKWTKVSQPKDINANDFFRKYNLPKRGKYIVLLGQEVCDKSIIHSKNPDVKSYEDYIYNLTRNNIDTTFLFKAHPVYSTIKKNDAHLIDFIYNYKNIVPIDESILSLFKIFDKFTAYSSTTILEGLVHNKKFATAGYHFCDNDALVYQLYTNEHYKNLYKKLKKFKINSQVRDKYLYFICNYYSIFCDSPQLVDRLELSSEEYFSKEY